MTGDQYVDSIKMMMETQNNNVAIFLAILTMVLGFMGFLQLRVSNSQIKKITKDVKEQAREEVTDELKESYELNKLPALVESYKMLMNLNEGLNNRINELEREISKNKLDLERQKIATDFTQKNQLYKSINEINLSKDVFSDLYSIFHNNYVYFTNDVENLNFAIEEINASEALENLEGNQSVLSYSKLMSLLKRLDILLESTLLKEFIEKINNKNEELSEKKA